MKIKLEDFTEDFCCKNFSVYFKSAYQNIFSENDNAKSECFKITFDDLGDIYLPFLIKEIDGYYEAYSAYGYGGFFYDGKNQFDALKEKLAKNWQVLSDFMSKNKIIDMFVRNSPFLENEELIPKELSEFNRTTYVRSLKEYQNFDSFLKNVSSKLRWSINYAIRNNLKAEFFTSNAFDFEKLRKFYEIYKNLMIAKSTQDYYFFDFEFFKKHFFNLQENCELGLVVDTNTGQVVAGSIFLLDKEMAHYHLSASKKEYSKYQPMELLLAEAIVRYGNLGKKIFHFGGGLSIDETDGLSRFKKKFATDTKNFYISKIIFDKKKYDELRGKYGLLDSNIFLIHDALKAGT